MRRIIRIFLASSIVEFANERMAIENFIRNISDKFEENYDVKIQPLLCENFDDAYSKIRKQEEYNEKIRNSDLCFFIFFTKAGEYTREEFEVARKKFEETGKPKIYTYFKVIKEETAEQSLYDFMDELDKIFGHYYGTFEHIDTVKLRILLNLKLQEMDFLEIKVDGDACVVDGKKTLSLENVSEFANNSIFQDLKAELYEVEGRYFNLKAKYEKDECSQSEEREYIEIATKRQNLIDAIEEVQKNIFNMSLRMCQDEARGEITLRQKEAYRLFESGDLEGANNILDFAEIKNDYQRRKAIREAEQKKDAQIFIRECRTKIDILKTLTKLPTRFEEIENLYDEIIFESFELFVELDTVHDYILFLYEQNKHIKALKIGEDLEKIYENNADVVSKTRVSKLNSLLGTICCDLPSKKDEAEKYLLKSIEMFLSLSSKEPELYKADLADSYNRIGAFYKNHGDHKKAKINLINAIDTIAFFEKDNEEKYALGLAYAYHNLANLNIVQCRKKEAESCFLRAVEFKKTLVNINPEKYRSNLSESYNDLGSLYLELDNKKAKKYLIHAIRLREELARENPDKYNHDLAVSYNNIGNGYSAEKNYDLAEAYLLKSIKIRENLAKRGIEKFALGLVINYGDLAVLYEKKNDFRKAEKYHIKSIRRCEALAKDDPKRINPDLALSYFNYGVFKKSRTYLLKAFRIAQTRMEHPYCKLIISSLVNLK